MANRRAVLIINRNARSGAIELHQIVAALAEGGVDARPIDGEQAASGIGGAAEGADLVIVGGGDGTLNRFAEPVVESGLPLGVIPLGTANDLARTLGLPTDPVQACAVIAAGHARPIDLGEVNGKLFFNVASIGLSVEVANRLTKQFKRRWGVFSYPLASMDAWKAMRSFRARITAGEKHVTLRSIQLSVGNGRFYGGGMSVSEDASIDDGMLDLYCLEPRRLMQMAALIPAFVTGRHRTADSVHCLRAGEITVETSRPLRVNTDGEVTAHTPARFRVLRHALKVFIPETAPGPGLIEDRKPA